VRCYVLSVLCYCKVVILSLPSIPSFGFIFPRSSNKRRMAQDLTCTVVAEIPLHTFMDNEWHLLWCTGRIQCIASSYKSRLYDCVLKSFCTERDLHYVGWSQQYVTQTNQPWARNLTSVNPFFNVVTYANTFGLEPNFVRYPL
jgi:hypothetical protein